MQPVEIIVHGSLTYGADQTTIQCPVCPATHCHTVRGDLDDDTIPVTLTCINGHGVPIPDEIDPRVLQFQVAMRAE